jgi:hypothetical protein
MIRSSCWSARRFATPKSSCSPQLRVLVELAEDGGDAVADGTQAALVEGDRVEAHRPVDGAIARDHGTTVAAIAAANAIQDVNRIFPGQVIAIP